MMTLVALALTASALAAEHAGWISEPVMIDSLSTSWEGTQFVARGEKVTRDAATGSCFHRPITTATPEQRDCVQKQFRAMISALGAHGRGTVLVSLLDDTDGAEHELERRGVGPVPHDSRRLELKVLLARDGCHFTSARELAHLRHPEQNR
jgi:hypothetical protein